MKKILHHVKKHYQKHHAKLKNLDHKVLEFIHGMELSVVLLLGFVAISSAFVFMVIPSEADQVEQQEVSIEKTLVREKIRTITQDKRMWKQLREILKTEEGKTAFLNNLMIAIRDENTLWNLRWAAIRDENTLWNLRWTAIINEEALWAISG